MPNAYLPPQFED